VNKLTFVSVGFAMGVVESALLFPIDTYKGQAPWCECIVSLISCSNHRSCVSGCFACLTRQKTNLQADGGVAKSTLRTARAMIAKNGGFISLYRGFWVSTVGTAPATVAYLNLYNELRGLGNKWCDRQGISPGVASLLVPFVSGGAADLLSLALYTPFDVVTTHMQRGQDKATYRGNVRQVVSGMYRTEGARGFFRGFAAAALTFTPTSALWWPSYEVCKRTLSPLFLDKDQLARLDMKSHGGDDNVEAEGLNTPASRRMAFVVALSGVLAGAVAYGLTNPMDLVRTRMILQQETYGEKRVLGVLRAVARREGFAALFKGVVPRVMSAAPASALGSFTYELALRISLKN
jgi:hypothetical protein